MAGQTISLKVDLMQMSFYCPACGHKILDGDEGRVAKLCEHVLFYLDG